MKKVISIFLITLLPVCWQSCEYVLEKVPDGQITLEKVLSNYTSSQGLIETVYNEIYTARDRVAYFFHTFEGLSDNAFRGSMQNAYDWNNGQLSLSEPVIGQYERNGKNQLWPRFWRGIRLANIAITYLPQSTVITEQERDTWVAEARVLRCWYYMNLLEFYGPVPWIDFPFEAAFDGWNDLVRPTYDEIATKISEELKDVVASGILPNSRFTTATRRVHNGVALAIRSRVLLNNASPLNNPDNDRTKWQRAADAAQDVLNLSDYSLVPWGADGDTYKHLFIGPNTTKVPEIIWRSWSDNGHISNTNAVNVGPYGSGVKAIWCCGDSPTQELVDCFEMKNGALPVTYNDESHTSVTVTSGAQALGYSEAPGGDPYANRDARFYIDIVHNGTDYGVPYNCTDHYIVETFVGGKNGFEENITNESKNSCTGYYSRKDAQIRYWGPNGSEGQGNESTFWVFFRLAEFILNKAEALCELNDLPGAKAALNLIRERAGQPPIEQAVGYVDSQDNLRQRIRNERRVELCLEGWRMHDQRRWKILDQTNRFVTGMKITKDAGGVLHYERVKIRDYESYTDKYLVMPIPLTDAKKMAGMTQPEAWK